MTPTWQSRAVCFIARLILKHRVWGSPATAVRWLRRLLKVQWPWSAWLGLRVSVQRVQEGSVRGEWLVPRAVRSPGVLLYLHGGGYISGSAALLRGISVPLCRLLGARVFSLDYRLAPEHPFPAAIEDAAAGYRWLLKNGVSPRDMVVAGESAGGGLAFALLLTLRGDARRMHQNAQAAGVPSRLSIYAGQPHGWHVLYGILPEATTACREAAEFVQECWRKPLTPASMSPQGVAVKRGGKK